MANHYEEETRKSKNRIRAVRKTNGRSGATSTHTINGDMDFCVVKNPVDNGVQLKVNFKNDDMDTNWWILEAGEETPVVRVSRDTDINYRTVSGNGKEVHILLWA